MLQRTTETTLPTPRALNDKRQADPRRATLGETASIAVCPDGKIAIGGGFNLPPSSAIYATNSTPSNFDAEGFAHAWQATALGNGSPGALTAYASCANVS